MSMGLCPTRAPRCARVGAPLILGVCGKIVDSVREQIAFESSGVSVIAFVLSHDNCSRLQRTTRVPKRYRTWAKKPYQNISKKTKLRLIKRALKEDPLCFWLGQGGVCRVPPHAKPHGIGHKASSRFLLSKMTPKKTSFNMGEVGFNETP